MEHRKLKEYFAASMWVVTGNEREYRRIWLRMKQKSKSKSTNTSHLGGWLQIWDGRCARARRGEGKVVSHMHRRQTHRQPIEGLQRTPSTLAVTASILAGTIHSYMFRFFSLLKMTVSVLCFLKNSSFVTTSGKRRGWGQNQDCNHRTPRKLSNSSSHRMYGWFRERRRAMNCLSSCLISSLEFN